MDEQATLQRSAGHIRLTPRRKLRQDEPLPYDLAEDEMPPRKLRTTSGLTWLQVGRLIVWNAGGGWLKVALLTADPDETEAELLPPKEAGAFVKWLSAL
jgi:hypothetical protein